MWKIYPFLKLFVDGCFVYWRDLVFYFRNSNVRYQNETEAKLLSTLIASYHIIEKGLSMPNRRLGFGQDVLLGLVQKIKSYMAGYGASNEQLLYAVSIIKEYDILHKENKFVLDTTVQSAIDSVLIEFDVHPARQIETTREVFFSKTRSSFDVFSSSRHSTRHFSGSIPIEKVLKAMSLAQNAPSACNKQPMKSYIVKDKLKLQKIIDLQQGNRGFGHLIDKIIVVTTRFSGCVRYSDRFYPFVDAGIYAMNVLYSLHFYEIGAIPLVWLSTHQRDEELRVLIGASSDEIPCLLIGIGELSEKVVSPLSPRKSLTDVVFVV